MHHLINPLIDCVFKAILGDPAHKEVLLAFLNAIMAPEKPILDVEILNPYSPSEFIGDDLRVVDIRACDSEDRDLHVEVQLCVRPWMSTRVVYQWADLYQGQLQRGEPFTKLRPLTSIWVLAQDLLPKSPHWHHTFQLLDPRHGTQLSEHLCIHTLELHKWTPPASPFAPEDTWAIFLKEAHGWTELPEFLRIPELEKAMSVLERFSDKREDYHRYQARMNYLREQACLSEERQQLAEQLFEVRTKLAASCQALAEKAAALAEKDDALSATAAALAEQQRAFAEQYRALAEKDLVVAQRAREIAQRDRDLAALEARLRALGVEP